MATQSAPTSPAQLSKTRAKKGDGPILVKFLNAKNEETKRVDADTEFLRVATKEGQSKDYSVTKLSLPTLRQLALDAIKRKFVTAVFSGHKNGKVDVLKVSDEIYNNILNGKIYVRAEGAARPGRKFDVTLWGEAMLRTSVIKSQMPNSKVKPFSKKVIDDFKVKLEGMSDKDRKVFTAKLQNDAVFKRALLEVKAERVKSATSEYDALSAI